MPLTPKRARQILDSEPRSGELKGHMTAEESAHVDAVWDIMPSDTCFMDAVRKIAHAIEIVIHPGNPLDRQLKHITGYGWNTINWFNINGLLVHKVSGIAFYTYSTHNLSELPVQLPENCSDLRDQFAASAMQGLISLSSDDENSYHVYIPSSLDLLCLRAYQVADAMLKARAGKDKSHE
jgi:hypothetical protein